MSFENTRGMSSKLNSTARLPGPIDDVKSSMGRALTLCSRGEALADRLVGTVPEAANRQQSAGTGGGLLYDMADQARQLDERLGDAEAALARIEKVVL